MTARAASLSVSLAGRLGTFALDAQFAAPLQGVTALFGASGCGKTTILRCLAGLMHMPGRIALGEDVWQDSATGRFVPPYSRSVGYVFQEASLFPHLSVRDNLLFGARRAGVPAPVLEAELADISKLLGIAHLISRSPTTLSGGERQRVAVGRALLSRPRILLMDEPLSALDRSTKEDILPYFERLVDRLDIPIIYVSHDVAEIARLAPYTVILQNGSVLASGSTSALVGGTDQVLGFGPEAAGAVLATRIARQHADGITEVSFSGGSLLLPHIDGAAGAAVRVRIAASEVMIATTPPEGISALNVIPAIVDEVRVGTGPGALVRLRCGDDALLARITRRSLEKLGLATGRTCYAVIKSIAIAKGNVSSALAPQSKPDESGE